MPLPANNGFHGAMSTVQPEFVQRAGIGHAAGGSLTVTRDGQRPSATRPYQRSSRMLLPLSPQPLDPNLNVVLKIAAQGKEIQISGKYYPRMSFPTKSRKRHYVLRKRQGDFYIHARCYEDASPYMRELAFYKRIEEIKRKDGRSAKRLEALLLRPEGYGQARDQKIGCILYRQPAQYSELKNIVDNLDGGTADFQTVRHMPYVFSQLISAIALLNKHGIAYNYLTQKDILVASVRKGWKPVIMLTGFDKCTVLSDSIMTNGMNPYRGDLSITQSFIDNIMLSENNRYKFNYANNEAINPVEKKQFEHDYDGIREISPLSTSYS
ncbi:hypothetical protein SYNPS1DRAFT_31370 [Syncephalis pseudoplumigaleata]|uniref:Protein kinase domain-containing protein n=1 Tax=Syncephalis pseudoplumigaleata TaxID=1712513 RepID=A0A4P9YTB0_9FUNG|nr:hypothetical protein SYNPS1DRAFT_31370 [Syncephalis pseudoplumigaleata]|eukprot:RKP22948.1 hypothetical protein SYNPS1DRAFT_31370 [Syncephalis pseudoplumigaleata]